jgi:tetratricopeptide (TPR) repeat protein
MTHLLAFALLAVVISFLYANTYRVPFFFDDMPNIVMNPYVPIEDLSWKSLKQVASESTNGRRWLPNISFSLNHYVDGFDVRGYHLVNIIIHIAAAFTLYLLGHLTLTLPSFSGGSRHAAEIAFAAALIWAVHPLQTNAVNYIIQRMTSMAALFYLLGLYCYVKARLQQPGAAKLIFFSLTIVLAFMAIVSKENSGMFPVVIIAYEILLLRRPDTGLFNQKKIALLLAGCFFLFIYICWHFLGSNPFASILSSYEHRAFSLGERLLSQARIVIHYLSLLVLPVPGRLNLMYEYQVSTGLLAPPQTLMAITLLAGLIFLVVRLYRHDRLFSFGICWLLVNLVVESSFIPLELVYEHRMYLPSMFLCLATVAWFYKLSASRPFRARIALFLVVSLLFAATWQRNTVWGNGIRFWSDVTAKSPNSMRGWINLGNAYSDAGNYTIAEQYLLKALALEKNDKSGNFSPESLKMTTANTHDALALIYQERKQYQRAIEHATLAMTLDPTRPNPLITLGIVYANLGEHQEAYKYFQQAWTKGLRNIDLFNNWAVSAFNLGRVDEAINMLHKALQIDPDHPESHYNLGVAYSSKGMLEEAQREMLRAMQLKQKK